MVVVPPLPLVVVPPPPPPLVGLPFPIISKLYDEGRLVMLNSVRPKLQDSFSEFLENGVSDDGVSKFFVQEASNSKHGTKRFFTGYKF